MKIFSILFILQFFCYSSVMADEIEFFAFVTVEKSSSNTETGSDGRPDTTFYSWDESFVIGWNKTTKRQVIAKAGGCNWPIQREKLVLRISDQSLKYVGKIFGFGQSVFKLDFESNDECVSYQNRLKDASYQSPVIVDIDLKEGSFRFITD